VPSTAGSYIFSFGTDPLAVNPTFQIQHDSLVTPVPLFVLDANGVTTLYGNLSSPMYGTLPFAVKTQTDGAILEFADANGDVVADVYGVPQTSNGILRLDGGVRVPVHTAQAPAPQTPGLVSVQRDTSPDLSVQLVLCGLYFMQLTPVP
jgi:hypothetical protein